MSWSQVPTHATMPIRLHIRVTKQNKFRRGSGVGWGGVSGGRGGGGGVGVLW